METERFGSGGDSRIPIALSGVPETMLWTLYYRAQEAEHAQSVIEDPLAVELVERIDYPFYENLGNLKGWAQWQGLRVRTFDEHIRRFLVAHPGGTVVALGEGLETQFWRVDDGHVRWVGVDLPETGQVRRQVLPAHERRLQVDGSVLDEGWMTQVDPARGVLITAQGLLMYLPRRDVHDLLTRCARRFPAAEMVFDGVPRWATGASVRRLQRSQGGRLMVFPPMPWSMNDREASALRALPGVTEIHRIHPPRGRGPAQSFVLPLIERLPVLRSQIQSIWSARFA